MLYTVYTLLYVAFIWYRVSNKIEGEINNRWIPLCSLYIIHVCLLAVWCFASEPKIEPFPACCMYNVIHRLRTLLDICVTTVAGQLIRGITLFLFYLSFLVQESLHKPKWYEHWAVSTEQRLRTFWDVLVQQKWMEKYAYRIGMENRVSFWNAENEYSGSKQTLRSLTRCTIFRRFIQSVESSMFSVCINSYGDVFGLGLFFLRVLPLLFDYVQLNENIIHQEPKGGVF